MFNVTVVVAIFRAPAMTDFVQVSHVVTPILGLYV